MDSQSIKEKQKKLKQMQKEFEALLNEYAKTTKQNTGFVKVSSEKVNKEFVEYIDNISKQIEELSDSIKNEMSKNKEDIKKKRGELDSIIRKIDSELINQLPGQEKEYEKLLIKIREARDSQNETLEGFSRYSKSTMRVLDSIIESSRKEKNYKELESNLEYIKQNKFVIEQLDKNKETENLLNQFNDAEDVIQNHIKNRKSFITRSLDFIKEHKIDMAGIAGALAIKTPAVLLAAKMYDDYRKNKKEREKQQKEMKEDALRKQREFIRDEQKYVKDNEKTEKLYSYKRERTPSYGDNEYTTSREQMLSSSLAENYLLKILNIGDSQLEILNNIQNILKDNRDQIQREQQHKEDQEAEAKLEKNSPQETLSNVLFGKQEPSKEKKSIVSQGIVSVIKDVAKDIGVGIVGGAIGAEGLAGLATIGTTIGGAILSILGPGLIAGIGAMGIAAVKKESETYAKNKQNLGEATQALQQEQRNKEQINKGNIKDIQASSSNVESPSIFTRARASIFGNMFGDEDRLNYSESASGTYSNKIRERKDQDTLEYLKSQESKSLEEYNNLPANASQSQINELKQKSDSATRKRKEFEKWLNVKKLKGASGLDINRLNYQGTVYNNPVLTEGFIEPSSDMLAERKQTREAFLSAGTPSERFGAERQRYQTTSDIKETNLQNLNAPLPSRQQVSKDNNVNVPASATELQSSLVKELQQHGITDKASISNIMAQAEAESGWKPRSEEPGSAALRAQQGPGDIYKGRGLIQLTGEANYKQMTEDLKKEGVDVDLVKNPELANDPSLSTKIAAIYYKKRQEAGYDLSNIESVNKATGYSSKVNSGMGAGTGGAEDLKREQISMKWQDKLSNMDTSTDASRQLDQQVPQSTEAPVQMASNNISSVPSQVNTDYASANTQNQGVKIDTAVAPSRSSGASGGSGGKRGGPSSGGGSSGRAAPRGNEYTLQSALNTDYSGSSA